MMPKVSIHIVMWNSRQYLPFCLRSIEQQSIRDFSLLVVDNNSSDGSVQYIKETAPQVKVFQNRQNLGFARAHNQAIRITQSPYILILNPDIVLTPTFIEKTLYQLEKRPKIGSTSGKLLKYYFEPEELKEPVLSKVIDAAGLRVLRSRRTFNRGEGEIDKGQYDQEQAVFGFSGAAVLYRRAALDEVMVNNEIFDEDFFVYKEDVDLAWRLQRRGWEAYYVPEALAYHHRGVAGDTQNDIKVIKQRKHHSRFVNGYSYSNHLSMLVKNEAISTWLLDFPWIITYELKKLLYLFFFEFSTLGSLKRFIRQLPKMREKRKLIKKKQLVSAMTLRNTYMRT